MMLECDARITLNHTGEILGRLSQISTVVERVVAWVQRNAADKAPVDTGALRASIMSIMVSKTEGIVGATVDYAAYVELLQPFLTPAYEGGRTRIEREIRALLTGTAPPEG